MPAFKKISEGESGTAGHGQVMPVMPVINTTKIVEGYSFILMGSPW
jgi:hypothetical protein